MFQAWSLRGGGAKYRVRKEEMDPDKFPFLEKWPWRLEEGGRRGGRGFGV